MRTLTLLLSVFLVSLGQSTIAFADAETRIQVAAEEGAAPAPASTLRTCSANSADRSQTCNVTCPEGKTATCTGGAQGAAGSDVDCTCK
jgi:hypothetical protein